MLALRSTRQLALRHRGSAARHFASATRCRVQLGDSLPDVELFEGSPGNKVNISKELTGKGVIVGVPAAYCTTLDAPLSSTHHVLVGVDWTARG
jgi:hypothetical protein